MCTDNPISGIDPDELARRRDPILSRFSIRFTRKVNINPIYHAVYASLRQGVGEYDVIEELLEANEKLSQELVRMNKNKLPKIFIKE